MDDDDLILRLRGAGDHERAFEILWKRHAQSAYGVALALTGRSAADAEDVVAHAMLSAWRDFGRFEGRARIRTWLLSIVRNRFLDLIRGRRELPAAESNVEQRLLDCTRTASSLVQSDERRARLTRALLDLAPDDRLLVYLYGAEQMSSADVGAVVGKSAEAIRKDWQRLKEKLKPRLVELELVPRRGI